MRSFRQIAVLAVLAAWACTDFTPPPTESISIAPDTSAVFSHGTVQLSVVSNDGSGNPPTGTVRWSSGNTGVATVDGSGLVTGQAAGTTTIIAAAGAAQAHATVQVLAAGTHLDVATDTVTLVPSGSYTIHAAIIGATGETLYTVVPKLTVSGAAQSVQQNPLNLHVVATTIGVTTLGLSYGPLSAAVTVVVRNLGPLTSITAMGGAQACAIAGAGELFCWGDNSSGQLGTGGLASENQVLPRPTRVPLAAAAVEVAGSGAFTCAGLAGKRGACWGQTTGLMTITSLDTSATFYVLDLTSYEVCAHPAPGLGGCRSGPLAPPNPYFGTADTASTGYVRNAIAVNLDPDLFAYGWCGLAAVSRRMTCSVDNGYYSSPVSDTAQFLDLSGSAYHMCAVRADSLAVCWFTNSMGQLGRGDTLSDSSSAPVSGGIHFARISAGLGHTCAITGAGAAYCWGDNSAGELGAASSDQCGGTACSLTPIAVSGGLAFSQISAGLNLTCGLTSTGVAYCWGGNAHGELGNGTVGGSSSGPVKVAGQP